MVPLLGNAIESALATYAIRDGLRGRCLDVGCGSQPWRSQLQQLGFDYYSLDCNQNTQQSVHYLGAIDQPLPLALREQQFQFILCTEVLEHVAQWPTAYANLAALLAPG